MQVLEIAKNTGMSSQLVQYHLKKLIKDKVIVSTHVAINYDKLKKFHYHLTWQVNSHDVLPKIIEYFNNSKKSIFATKMVGNYDGSSEVIVENSVELRKVIDGLNEKFSEKISGFRAPYFKLSENTLQLISNRGYIYDSSLMADDHPYFLNLPDSSSKLIEFPVEWFLDDWVIFETHQHPPTAAFDIWRSHFDAFTEFGEPPHCINYTFHPACIGHAYRLQVLNQLISYLKQKQAQILPMVDVASSLLSEIK